MSSQSIFFLVRQGKKAMSFLMMDAETESFLMTLCSILVILINAILGKAVSKGLYYGHLLYLDLPFKAALASRSLFVVPLTLFFVLQLASTPFSTLHAIIYAIATALEAVAGVDEFSLTAADAFRLLVTFALAPMGMEGFVLGRIAGCIASILLFYFRKVIGAAKKADKEATPSDSKLLTNLFEMLFIERFLGLNVHISVYMLTHYST